MVHVPSRGDGPRRIGRDVEAVPDIGPSDLDASVYSDPARYALERERVFRHNWIIAARGEEAPEAGDHVLYEGHGETIAIVRQRDGGLAAFHNVCQHRGARIVPEPGERAHAFTCPWHGWVYGLDGTLRGVPDREDFSPAQLDKLCAPKVAVREWAGWVFLCLAGPDEAPDFDEWLGEIGAELERYKMEDMFVADKLVYDLPCNYKVVVDGFNEAYHIAALHQVPKLVSDAARNTTFNIMGLHSMMVVPMTPDHIQQLEETGDHQGITTCHYVLFPNAVFNNLPNHLQLFLPVPLGPNRTRFECWELHYKDGDDAYRESAANAWKFLKPIVEQDIFIFKELDHTRDSMAYTTNRFSDRECKPTAYHEQMARQCGDGRAPVRVAKDAEKEDRETQS